MINDDNMDIIGNMKAIDNYKTFLLSSVADLFSTMGKGSKANVDDIIDELSEVVILSYLLGKRLSLDYHQIDDRMLKKLKIGLLEENSFDKDYQDYSKLISYIKSGRDI